MSPLPPSHRLLTGNAEPPMRGVEITQAPDSISFHQVLTVLRRRYQIILVMTLVGVSVGLLLASRQPARYQATATIRFAGERTALTGDNEHAPGLKLATTDPLMTISQLVK